MKLWKSLFSPDRLELHIQGVRREEGEDTLGTKERRGTSLEGQWLRFHAYSAEGLGSVLDRGPKIPQAAWCRGKKKKERVGREKRDISFTGTLTGNRGRKMSTVVHVWGGEVQGALVYSVDSHSGGAVLFSAEST